MSAETDYCGRERSTITWTETAKKPLGGAPFCQYAESDGNLASMGVMASWTRTIAAIFTMAMFYASACTATCALGVCPNQTQQTSSHDCESSTAHHSHHSSIPGKPDCSKHGHPSTMFVKSPGVAKTDLAVLAHVSAGVLFASPRNLSVANLTASDGSDLAPPLIPGVPIYQQISVLRI